jgi:hypothetical protein
MRNLIFNSNNVVSGSFNSRFRYTFSGGGGYQINEGDQIALCSLQIPYSWYNISSLNGNNSYRFSFNGTVYTVTMPDGFYTITDIDNYLQFFCKANNLYTLSSTGSYVFYCRWSENTSKYAIQWDAFPISLSSSGTNPNGITLSGNIPLLIMQNNTFTSVVGISAGTYPTVTQTSTYSLTSNITPNLTFVNSLIVNSNLVKNSVSVSANAFNSFAIDTTFGSNINYKPNFPTWMDCIPGFYTNIDIFLTDQNYNMIRANDPNVCIEVIIRSKGERS